MSHLKGVTTGLLDSTRCWSNGVVEYWSIGIQDFIGTSREAEKKEIECPILFSTKLASFHPISELHYSNTPRLLVSIAGRANPAKGWTDHGLRTRLDKLFSEYGGGPSNEVKNLGFRGKLIID